MIDCKASASILKSKLMSYVKHNWLCCIEIVTTLLLCFVHALSAGHYANFYPINGTFQNYNPVRRLLEGQIPYKDFQDYLGLGHLYLGSIFTKIFGGTYRSSLVAFSFLAFGSLAIISYMVAMSVFNQREKAIAISNIILTLILINPLVLTNAIAGTNEILNALNNALGTGISARFVRGMILPIIILIIWIGYLVYGKFSERHKRISNYKNMIIDIGIGVIAGCGFAWSNDYGISSWVCLFIMTFWISLCRNRKLLRALVSAGLELVSSFVGMFISVEIFTVGHFREWFSSTFGTGGIKVGIIIRQRAIIYMMWILLT
jgi:hypothetical protein